MTIEQLTDSITPRYQPCHFVTAKTPHTIPDILIMQNAVIIMFLVNRIRTIKEKVPERYNPYIAFFIKAFSEAIHCQESPAS